MKEINLKEIRIHVPFNIADFIREKEILDMLFNKVTAKMIYYQTQCKFLEEKYKMKFSSFKKKLNDSKHENFSEWDDLILWEAYMLGYKEWKEKYRHFKKCLE
ncbi:MAG: hypothetical protein HY738_01560 [Bacteroidia bacterium]|nr:hypothetical protein [Bacteroidia bacterium]